MKRTVPVALFLAAFLILCGFAAYRMSQPLVITVDYPQSTLTDRGELFVMLRVGRSERLAYYANPLAFESQLIAWKGNDNVRVVEVME